MAAYASVVSVMNIMENIQTHPRHSFSFDYNQIKSLREIVDCLVDFLECYSHGGGKEAEELESQIASAARKAEDVIESHVVDQIQAGSTLNGETSSCFLEDLQKVIEEMDSVKEVAMDVKTRRGRSVQQPAYSRPTTSSRTLTTGENAMIGFDDELIHLMEMLTAQRPNRQIIPIVGMGGIGKTTLTSNVYEHLHIVQYFDVRFWATVSQQCSAKKILLELLFGGNESTCETVHELGEKLHKTLSGRRYLVVLDDMWSIHVWDEIQMFFPDNGNGSRIVMTSRQSNLAIHLCSSNFVMKFLDKNKSWKLFCEKAFGEEGCPPDIEEVGKKIVRNCKGLPLSLVVIGGHLRKSSRTEVYWEAIANDLNSILDSVEDEECLNILSLSYSYLPVYLKPCLLYFVMFPEDKKILVNKLSRLWVAEGFIKPNEAQSLEEVAESWLKDLVDRNLILVRGKTYAGEVHSCSIHDLLRELCIRIAEKEKFFCLLDRNTRPAIHKERRIVNHKTKWPREEPNPEMFDALRSARLLRSLIWYEGVLSFDLRLLRVLQWAKTRDNEYVWPSIDAQFQQVNLKYIEYRHNGHGTLYLPSSISQLWNMQTLSIGGGGIIFLPSEIWEMPQLRHLIIKRLRLPDPLTSDGLDQLDCFVLRNLQTLWGVENFRMSEEVCKRIPNIKGLKVQYGDFKGEWESILYYCPHNIGRFQKLEILHLYFSEKENWREFALNLTFPSSVGELTLKGCRLHWEDLTMIGLLPRIAVLVLNKKSVVGPEWNPAEGQFRSLKFLEINSCNDLTRWNANRSHFPLLKTLRLNKMSELDEVPSDIGEIPTLKRIKLHRCSVSAAFSAAKIVVEQEELGNEGLRLQVTFLRTKEKRRFREMMEAEGMISNNIFVG